MRQIFAKEQKMTGQLLTDKQRKCILGRLSKNDHSNPSKVRGEVRRIQKKLPEIIDSFVEDLILLQNNVLENDEQRQSNYRAIEKGIKTVIERSDIKRENLGIKEFVQEQRRKEKETDKAYKKFLASKEKTIDKLFQDKGVAITIEAVKKLQSKRYPKAKKALLEIYNEILLRKVSSKSDLLVQKRHHKSFLNQLAAFELLSWESDKSKYHTLTPLGIRVAGIIKQTTKQRGQS